MGKISVGNVVFVSFPYSNLKKFKLRPALVCAVVDYDDLVLCQITSKYHESKNTIKLTNTDFEEGELEKISYIRSGKLFNIEKSEIVKKVGSIKKVKMNEVLGTLRELFKEQVE